MHALQDPSRDRDRAGRRGRLPPARASPRRPAPPLPRRRSRAREADGRASRRHAQAARQGRRRLARPADQLHAPVLAALPVARRTAWSRSRRPRGRRPSRSCPTSPSRIPKPTDGGKTWTFKLRKGIKYSTGETVQPRDFLWTFQRIFKVHTPTAGGFYSVLVGADKCLKTPATCDLSKGVVINNKAGTVTFHLTQPDAEWLDKLAVPHAAVLPVGHAEQGPRHEAPAVAPARTCSRSTTRTTSSCSKRNPNFKEWSADAQPDGYLDSIALHVRPHGRGRGHADRERPGRLDARLRRRPTASTRSARSTRTRCTSTRSSRTGTCR